MANSRYEIGSFFTKMRKEPIFLWGVYWIVQLLTFPVHLIPFQIDASQDGARNAVPGATNGTRKDGKWLGGKEVSGQDGGKTGVLHSHFDADGAFLGCVEACQLTCQPAEAIAQGVVAEDDGKGPEGRASCHVPRGRRER